MAFLSALLSWTGASAAEASPEAQRIAKIAAPFVTPDTFLLLQADLAETDLPKVIDSALAGAKADERQKAQLRGALAPLTKDLADFKAAGWEEVVVIFGCKFKADGAPKLPPQLTLAVRKAEGVDAARAKRALTERLTFMTAPFLSKTAEQGDWLYFAAEDPRPALKKNDKKSLPLMKSLFDRALAPGPGLHIALMPQPAPRAGFKKFMPPLETEGLPPKLVETRKDAYAFIQALSDSKLTLLSLVDDPDPGLVFQAVAADETSAEVLAKVMPKMMFGIPYELVTQTFFSDNYLDGAIDAVVDVLEPHAKPQVQGAKVTASFKKSDGRWSELADASLDAARAYRQLEVDQHIQAISQEFAFRQELMKSFFVAEMRFDDDNDRVPAELRGKVQCSWRFGMVMAFGSSRPEDDWVLRLDYDKAWNDPANRDVVAKTHKRFRHPMFPDDPPGTTRYALPRFPGGPYEGPQRLKLADVTDGPSQTISIVVLDKPVAVADPSQDWKVDLSDPTKGLAVFDGYILAGTLDGKVVKLKVDEKDKLKKMLTHNGGEMIE